ATGVGGILRDVFTMGARPVACLNALSFGDPKYPKTRALVAGVVAGIGGYRNTFGAPPGGGPDPFPPPHYGQCFLKPLAAGPPPKPHKLPPHPPPPLPPPPFLPPP